MGFHKSKQNAVKREPTLEERLEALEDDRA